eukprot:TRINITY_DN27327_c0_g1_i1.p1 TRINITY_DN27327_c0_g1~~TRINITY_DN27327_c0_g1_i1.p1  ORF type:complete len:541 (+),score=218.13 TRINITY_DN27327_c0_g1_i1:75-1697(+)
MATEPDGDATMADDAATAPSEEKDEEKKEVEDSDASPRDTGATAEEKVALAEAAKEVGNTALKAGELPDALARYGEGITAVEPYLGKSAEDVGGEDIHKRIAAIALALRLNAAMACVKLSDWSLAIEHADKALDRDADNCKALYRRGLSCLQLGQLSNSVSRIEQARADLTRVAQLEPGNRDAREHLLTAKEKVKELRAAEKQRFSVAMQGGLYQEQHQKQVRLQARYEQECNRRKEAGEDEITFENWLKKDKEAEEEQKKKEKEAREEKEKEERRQALEKVWTEDNERRKAAGQEELSFEDWQTQLAAEEKARRGKKEEVMNASEVDLDEDEKKLLEETKSKGYYHGRLGTVLSMDAPKPQQVESTAAAEGGDADGASKPSVGSEWNKAGTWEEKSMTTWVKEKLCAFLPEAAVEEHQVSLAGGEEVSASAKITKVKSCSGEASLVTVRGKRKCGYDFHGELSFTVYLKGADESDGEFSGTFSLPEIHDSVAPESLKVNGRWKKAPAEKFEPAASDLVEKLKQSVRLRVASFVEEYSKC